MNDVKECIRAASPWVAMGLLVAILVIRGAASTKNATVYIQQKVEKKDAR